MLQQAMVAQCKRHVQAGMAKGTFQHIKHFKRPQRKSHLSYVLIYKQLLEVHVNPIKKVPTTKKTFFSGAPFFIRVAQKVIHSYRRSSDAAAFNLPSKSIFSGG